MGNVYEDLEDYNPTKKKSVIVSDDMTGDMEANKKKISPIDPEFFLRGRKLNILLVFISQYYLKVSNI